MIPFTLSEMTVVLGAEWIGEDRIINTVSINSNVITDKCLFVALKGKRFDGHNFINEAIFMGAIALLVDRYLCFDIPQLVVKNTHFALAQLGFWVRMQVSSKVIAITGSSGKTSVKEMTASILRYSGKVVSSYGNFNNEVGVPLTLLRLTHKVDFIVIEVGASNFGEIFKITSLMNPNIVLINNIFPAHLSGFESLIGVAEAKGEIFSHVAVDGICVFNADNNLLLVWKKLLLFKSILIFSIQKRDKVHFFATNIVYGRNHMRFNLHTPCGISPVTLSMLGYHNISNALAASALAFSAGATLHEIVMGLEKIHALPGRLFPILLGRGKLLLDDSYNANIGSVLMAMYVLKRMQGYLVMVIGDMVDLGDEYTSFKYHREIGKLISKTNINKVLSIGCLSYFVSYYSERGKHYYNKDVLMMCLVDLFFKYEVVTVLIKGSRNIYMDSLVIGLQKEII